MYLAFIPFHSNTRSDVQANAYTSTHTQPHIHSCELNWIWVNEWASERTQSPHFDTNERVHMKCLPFRSVRFCSAQLSSAQLSTALLCVFLTESKMCVLIACISVRSMYCCHMICYHCIGIPAIYTALCVLLNGVRIPNTLLRRIHSWSTHHNQNVHDRTCLFGAFQWIILCVFSVLSIVTFSLLPPVTSLWPCSYRVSISFRFYNALHFLHTDTSIHEYMYIWFAYEWREKKNQMKQILHRNAQWTLVLKVAFPENACYKCYFGQLQNPSFLYAERQYMHAI